MAIYEETADSSIVSNDADSDGLLLYDDTLLEEAIFSPSSDLQALFNPLALEQALFLDETETIAEWLAEAIKANDSVDSLVSGLKEFYRLDEPTGAVISGVKGNAYTCDMSYYTRAWGGVYRNALRCTSTSTSSYGGGIVRFPGMNLTANDSAFSIAAWIKKDSWSTSWTSAWQPIINNTQFHSDSGRTTFPGIVLFFSGTSPVHLYFYVIANNTIYSLVFPNVHQWVDNTWYHVVATCDPTTNTMKIYLNGDLIDTGFVASTLNYEYNSYPPYSAFAIGNYSYYRQYNQIGGCNFNGLGAWDIVLDQAKIDRLYAYHPDNTTSSDTVVLYDSWGVPADAVDQVLLYADFSARGDVIEAILTHDALGFFRSTFVSSAEAVNVLDQYHITIPLNLIDALEIEGLIATTDGIILREAIVASDQFQTRLYAEGKILQNISVKARSIVALSLVIAEGLTVEDVLSGETAILLRVVDKLIATGAVSTRLEAVAEIIQSLLLSEAIHSGKDAEALEAFYLQPDVLDQLRAVARTVESIILEATPVMTGSLRLPVIESLNLEDTPTTQGILNSLVSEGVAFRLTFNTGDATYTGWVMNATTFSVSEYDNYPFNSFAQIQGQYYGTNDNGMYLLEGENDAGIPIQARVRLGETNFGKSVLKRLDSVYLGFRADGSLVLKTVTEGNIERWYQVRGDTEKLHRTRVHPLAKGHKAVWWEFSLENVDGADFEVSEIEFVPVMLSRSV